MGCVTTLSSGFKTSKTNIIKKRAFFKRCNPNVVSIILFDNILVQYVRLRNRSLRRHFLRVVDYSRKGWHGNINSTLKEPNKRPLNNGVTMFSPSFSLTLPMNSSSGLLLLCLRWKNHTYNRPSILFNTMETLLQLKS